MPIRRSGRTPEDKWRTIMMLGQMSKGFGDAYGRGVDRNALEKRSQDEIAMRRDALAQNADQFSQKMDMADPVKRLAALNATTPGAPLPPGMQGPPGPGPSTLSQIGSKYGPEAEKSAALSALNAPLPRSTEDPSVERSFQFEKQSRKQAHEKSLYESGHKGRKAVLKKWQEDQKTVKRILDMEPGPEQDKEIKKFVILQMAYARQDPYMQNLKAYQGTDFSDKILKGDAPDRMASFMELFGKGGAGGGGKPSPEDLKKMAWEISGGDKDAAAVVLKNMYKKHGYE